MRTVTLLPVLLGACVSPASVVEDMERALSEASDGILAALFTAEVLTNALEAPDFTLRHSTTDGCGCPCISALGAVPPVLLTFDYRIGGCIPDSGLLIGPLDGHVYGDFDGDEIGATSYQDLLFMSDDDLLVGGTFGGAVSGTETAFTARPVGTVVIGEVTLTVDLTVELVGEELLVAGSTARSAPDLPVGDAATVTFADLVIPLDEITIPCPRPSSGTASLVDPRRSAGDASIDFARPGDGFVTVTRGNRESEATDLCAYKSELW